MCNRETKWLILLKEVIIYCENLMQHTSSRGGKMQSFLMLQEMVCVTLPLGLITGHTIVYVFFGGPLHVQMIVSLVIHAPVC